MNRSEKELVIESLKNNFLQSQASFLIEIKGLPVSKIQLLRKALYQHGIMKLAKNTLAKKATENIAGMQGLKPYLKEQIAFVFAPSEASVVAKILCKFAKEEEKLKIIAGSLESEVIDKSKILFLGSLPPKEVIMARICGALKASVTRIAWVLKQRAEKSL
ncbi:MAG: 50S ribosomal protein L10 [Candidatus Babeliaceae bacterium]